MGQPKANLVFGDNTVLELGINAARQAGIHDHIIVVGHHEDEIKALHRNSLSSNVVWVTNPQPELGMLTSLKLALNEISDGDCSGFFFSPVDYPLVRSADYRALLNAFNQLQEKDEFSSEGCVLSPSYRGKRGHPVLCSMKIKEKLLNLSDRDTPKAAFENSQRVEVAVEHEGVLLDMDTPEDYARLQKIYESR